MKVFFLLGIVIAAGLTGNSQKTLFSGLVDCEKLFVEARAVAINAAKNNLNMIRTDLDYEHDGTLLYNSEQLS